MRFVRLTHLKTGAPLVVLARAVRAITEWRSADGKQACTLVAIAQARTVDNENWHTVRESLDEVERLVESCLEFQAHVANVQHTKELT